MKPTIIVISQKTIAPKSLLAFLYLAAFFLSVQLPNDFQKHDRYEQSVFEQQSICLIPMEVRGNRLINSPVNLIPVIFLPLSGFFESHRLRVNFTLSFFQDHSSTVFIPFREIVITMRRLRI
jgi:hypothetical protein